MHHGMERQALNLSTWKGWQHCIFPFKMYSISKKTSGGLKKKFMNANLRLWDLIFKWINPKLCTTHPVLRSPLLLYVFPRMTSSEVHHSASDLAGNQKTAL